MITRRELFGLAALIALVPRRLRAAAHTPRELFVYNAVSGDAGLLTGLGSQQTRLIELPELKLGRWNVRIGIAGEHLLALDTEGRRLHAVRVGWLRERLRGEKPALGAHDLRTTALRSGEVPYRAVLHGDRVWVDYFSGNRIEAYRWRTSDGFSYLGEHVLPGARPLGLSELLIHRDRLWVAASGLSCLARSCPKETAPDPHVFAFQLDDTPLGAQSHDVRPQNVNAAGLYVHPSSAALYVINAGEYRGGYSSIQRLRDDATLGPEIPLARNAGAARAYALDAGTFMITQFSGEHVFVFDARRDALLATLRFDHKARHFLTVPPGSPLSERPSSDLQDVLPDPARPGRFYFIDSKREQLLHVTFRAPRTLEVSGATSLRTSAFRSSPSWAVWLP